MSEEELALLADTEVIADACETMLKVTKDKTGDGSMS